MEREERSPTRCTEQNLLDTGVGHDESSLVIPSELDNVVPAQPAKRPTRQWAAWTREEEECFFNALRQVGKNFEKITCRVESKNKDQVRHYYYRLVRRMNKLLGPGLCLDAKNSKDTNAAMLRWWSLLEKYSCKASKLHLKPRRFKIFVEALEHQLLKDRKKNTKKRSSQGEPCSSSTSTSPNQNKPSGNESRAVKLVAIDGQNAQKAGNGKGSSARRNSNLGVARNTNKGDSSPIKSTRQRRKTGVVSAAAIKRWEKAAIDGVSLVADAAEHVERTAGVKQAGFLDGLTVLSVQAVGCSMEQNDPGPSGDVHSNSLIKLKLQLFPIDDNTRRALEMDKHNPHLELTLSTKKKISSVLEHIGRKWGNSSVASGELMLFPFNTQRENLVSYNRWTRDSAATATEVYAMIGSPPVFRLRYGWIVSTELQSVIRKAPAALPSNRLGDDTDGNNAPVDSFPLQAEKKDENEKHDRYNSGDQPTQNGCAAAVSREVNITNANVSNDVTEPTNFTSILKRNGSCDGSTSKKIKNMVDYRLRKSPTLSAGEWADSLTNVSVGDLLPDAPNTIVASCVESPALESSRCVEQVPFTCDSFDAAIAAHILKQNKLGYSVPSPHLSSIWDAEETCDEFSFRKRAIERRQHPYPATPATSFAGDRCANSSEDINDVQDAREAIAEDVREEDRMDDCPSEPREVQNISRDFSSLTDICWPDSLGPLELDVPSCKYYSEDLILSDSLSGLNRFIANSLDAFQHCSLFSLDDKRPSPAADVQGGASFAGKICTGDSSGVQPLQV